MYTSVLYGFLLGIQLTTDAFAELPDDGRMRTETCSSYLGLFK
jgi:hypothetical protein